MPVPASLKSLRWRRLDDCVLDQTRAVDATCFLRQGRWTRRELVGRFLDTPGR